MSFHVGLTLLALTQPVEYPPVVEAGYATAYQSPARSMTGRFMPTSIRSTGCEELLAPAKRVARSGEEVSISSGDLNIVDLLAGFSHGYRSLRFLKLHLQGGQIVCQLLENVRWNSLIL